MSKLQFPPPDFANENNLMTVHQIIHHTVVELTLAPAHHFTHGLMVFV